MAYLGGTLQMGIQTFFVDYWYIRCLDWCEQAYQTGNFEDFELSLKILNGRWKIYVGHILVILGFEVGIRVSELKVSLRYP